jgi:hypothetical protein
VCLLNLRNKRSILKKINVRFMMSGRISMAQKLKRKQKVEGEKHESYYM